MRVGRQGHIPLLGIPRGARVALSADEGRLIAYAADVTEVVKRAKELGESDPVIVRVPEDSSSLLAQVRLAAYPALAGALDSGYFSA